MLNVAFISSGRFSHELHECHESESTIIRAIRVIRGGNSYPISSIIAFSSAGISGIGTLAICIVPSAAFLSEKLNFANSGSFAGKSSRYCPPRLSLRSIAARAMASETVSRLCRSSAVCQPGLKVDVARRKRICGPLFQNLEAVECLFHFVFDADDADEVLHHLL